MGLEETAWITLYPLAVQPGKTAPARTGKPLAYWDPPNELTPELNEVKSSEYIV